MRGHDALHTSKTQEGQGCGTANAPSGNSLRANLGRPEIAHPVAEGPAVARAAVARPVVARRDSGRTPWNALRTLVPTPVSPRSFR